MTVPLKFRQAVNTKPTTTEIKNAPLSNIEVDGNFHSIQDSVEEIQANNWVTTNRVADAAVTPTKLSNDGIGFRYKIGLLSANNNTSSNVISKGTTEQRDASPQEGYVRYNTTISRIEWRGIDNWEPITKQSDSIYIGTTAVPLNRESGALTLNNVNISGSVTETATQTLTNKTLTAPSISGAIVSDGVSNGVTYLNGSKQLTSGTGLQFDGSKLRIDTATADTKVQIAGNTTAYTGADIQIYRTGSGSASVGQGANLQLTNSTDSSQVLIQQHDGNMQVFNYTTTGGSWQERMRLDSVGNMGIGTTSPTSKLDVNGTVKATGWSGGGIVTETATQQLSNKTLSTGSVWNGGTIGVLYGGTGVTTLTGIVRGNGTGAFSAATANQDYLVPSLANTAVSGFKTATFNSQGTIAATSGNITINWTDAQNQKQTTPTNTINYLIFVNPPGPCHLQLMIPSGATTYTVTWPAGLIWMSPSYSAVVNKTSIVNFWYDGTNYYAMVSYQQ